MSMEISIEALIDAPLTNVWSAWVSASDISKWNFASNDWLCPRAEIDLMVGAGFNYRMEAKDGSMGFDFKGVFTDIEPESKIEYELADGRKVLITFAQTEQGIRLVETFEAENEFSAAQQKAGWQCILNNFKQYVETL
ncbi:SRPBCC domain-containing protein [Marinicella rhabdoformis]|uniref:SRPBCC domain-containing protein n=1 Tax=Marinicella rhabdoformis TaxID=2580566 RepID=UPI001FE5A500|nr:SRPBCC domain-containing protein [Marinicella rhabdoformis]